MTLFEKQWVTSTLAPESIFTIKMGTGNLHKLVNENKTNECYVLELRNNDLYVAKEPKDLIKAIKCNYNEACNKICKLLNIQSFQTT